MRAVVDNPDLAALTGAPPITIARTSWMLGSVLAAVAGILYAPTAGALDAINLTFFVIAAYGAAVFGRLRSLPLTFAGAIVLGLIQGYAPISFPQSEVWNHLQVGVPGIFLFLVLLALPEAKLTVGRLVGRDVPPVPRLRTSVVRERALRAGRVRRGRLLRGRGRARRRRPHPRADLRHPPALPRPAHRLLRADLPRPVRVLRTRGVRDGQGRRRRQHPRHGRRRADRHPHRHRDRAARHATAGPLPRAGHVRARAGVARRHLPGHPHLREGRRRTSDGSTSSALSFEGDAGVRRALRDRVRARRRSACSRSDGDPFGRRLAAIRDSQAACATLGLDVRRTKLAVFALSSAIAGLAGSLYGGLGFTVEPARLRAALQRAPLPVRVRRRHHHRHRARSSAGCCSRRCPSCSPSTRSTPASCSP